jgi:hypothetical protein
VEDNVSIVGYIRGGGGSGVLRLLSGADYVIEVL